MTPDPNPTFLLSRTEYAFDDQGNLRETKKDGRIISTQVWLEGRKTSETDESGILTSYEDFDFRGEPRRIIRQGLAVDGVLPAIPALTTTRVFDAVGRTTSETVSDGTSTMSRTWLYDTRGRITQETENGKVTGYAYTDGGRTATKTLPGGLTEITQNYLDGRAKRVSGTAVLEQNFVYSVEAGGFQKTKTLIGTGTDRLERYTMADLAGRLVEEGQLGAGGLWRVRAVGYNGNGAIGQETQTGLANKETTAGYGGTYAGRWTRTTQDAGSQDGGIRERMTNDFYELINGVYYHKSLRSPGAGGGFRRSKTSGFAPNEISQSIETDPLGNETTTTITVDRNTKQVRSETTTTGMNAAVVIVRAGLAQSATTPSVSAPAIFGYDGHGREVTSKDPRTNVVTTTTYDTPSGNIQSVTGPGQNVFHSYYPATDRRTGKLNFSAVNGRITYHDYDLLGRLSHIWGATNPVRYEYDEKGRLWKLRTFRAGSETLWVSSQWPAFVGDGDVTTWSYHPGTVLLQAKTDALGKATSYTYWPSGLLNERIWARLGGTVKTTYTYNAAGERKLINYSDTTPDASFNYDALGRIRTASDAAGAHTFTYNAANQLESESVATGGLLGGLYLDPRYTSTGVKGRIDQLNVGMSAWSTQQTFGYDAPSGRMSTIGFGVLNVPSTVTYGYLPNSDWLSTITSRENGTQKMLTTRTPDDANRLSGIHAVVGVTTADGHQVRYNAAGQRDRVAQADGLAWEYGYNIRGEVIAGSRRWSDGTPVPGHQFGYQFDPIGNRQTTTVNGRSASYVPNAVNQYIERTVPGAIDVSGEAAPEATVTVNGANAIRRGGFFYKDVSAANASSPAYPSIMITGVRNLAGSAGEDGLSQISRSAFLPQTPEVFKHDEDGNLMTDGRWRYKWDAENRLIAMETLSAAVSAGAPRQKLEFSYDWRGRRVRKKVNSLAGPTAGTQAVFLQADTVTKGNWQGVYGATGYDIAGDSAVLPSYVQKQNTGFNYHLWNAASMDARALQRGADGRIMSTYYNTGTATIDLNFTDGRSHRFAMYFADYDGGGRVQRVRIRNATTNAILNERVLSGFSGGVYWVWKLSGQVRIEVIHEGGWNAVVAGMFFDEEYTTALDRKFIYDEEWNLLTETDGNNSPVRRYVWGLDLSGTRHGAGGIGGLLAFIDPQGSGSSGGYHIPTQDANGNITALNHTLTGLESARYTYGPFGEPLRVTGSMANANPFRFSSKYTDQETGLSYYGYRYYQPQTGRWTSRDPIEEAGGVALYVFVENNAFDRMDLLGLEAFPVGAGAAITISQNDVGAKASEMARHGAQVAYDASIAPIKNWKPKKVPPTGLDVFGPPRNGLNEWGGRVCCQVISDGKCKITTTGIVEGNSKGITYPACEGGWATAGFFHSHPNAGQTMSKTDDKLVNTPGGPHFGIPSWIAEFGGWDGPAWKNKEKPVKFYRANDHSGGGL